MYTLMQHLIAFKYACKINHWSTDSYSQHLLFDRLAEDLDTYADNIAESHFMALNKKDVFKADLLNPKLINKNLVKMCETIIEYLEKLQNDDDLNEGDLSLLGDIESAFLRHISHHVCCAAYSDQRVVCVHFWRRTQGDCTARGAAATGEAQACVFCRRQDYGERCG